MSALLNEEQARFVAERMPSAGRLTTVADAEYAYTLRRAHTSYETLKQMFACSRSSLRRAIRLVAAVLGNDPNAWVEERRQRRQGQVASFYAHRTKIKLRRETIEKEVRELRAAHGIQLVAPEPPQPDRPRDAYAEQQRLSDAHAGSPPVPSPSLLHGTPARRPRNPFYDR